MKHIVCISLMVVCVTSLSCSGVLDRLIPDSLDGKGEIKLTRKYSDDGAVRLFDADPVLNAALVEFKPEGVSAGAYDFRGIIIYLGMARCSSADNAFGIYSSLTAMPRDRWEYAKGEISYRPPYVSGYNGEYVFWIYSPTNPGTYTGYFKQHGEKMLAEFDTYRRQPNPSYHWEILPEENRFKDSIFYVRSRSVNGIEVANAYAATYQVQYNVANIYVMKFDSEADAASGYLARKRRLTLDGKGLTDFLPMPGASMESVHWQEKTGTWTLCRYRWMMFLFQDMPSVEKTKHFTHVLFRYMTRLRDRVLPKRK